MPVRSVTGSATLSPMSEPLLKRQRHLNFTERVRISPQWLSLTLVRPDAGCTEVDFIWRGDCDEIEPTPERSDVPCGIGPERFGNAEVFIEGSRQTFWQRRSAGRACDLAEAATRGQPLRLDFDEFDSLEGVRFRLKVTGRSDHNRSRLLAVAHGLRVAGLPDDVDGRSLLPVITEDLGQRPYRLDFDDGGPLLVLNSLLGPKEAVAIDPTIVSLVLPAAIRQIAVRLLADSHGISDAELNVSSDWRADWFGFLRDRLKIHRLSLNSSDEADLGEFDGQDSGDEDQEVWAESVVDAFCSHNTLKDRLLSSDAWTVCDEDHDE